MQVTDNDTNTNTNRPDTSADRVAARLKKTCAVIVNYQTPDLLDVAVRSFKAFYPDLPLIVLDNGSQDNSRQVIERLCEELPSVNAQYSPSNVGHGPAMDSVIAQKEFAWYFFLDSDTETKAAGFLEEMLSGFDDANLYAVGHVIPMNKRGFVDASGFPALDAAYMLIRQEHYARLPSFAHHGAPVVLNFMEASKQQLRVQDFPIQDFIDHLHRGTVARFGYGLGLKGKINFLLNKLGI